MESEMDVFPPEWHCRTRNMWVEVSVCSHTWPVKIAAIKHNSGGKNKTTNGHKAVLTSDFRSSRRLTMKLVMVETSITRR